VGEDAVNRADTLEQLERQNLFVVPLIAIALGIGITTCSQSHCVILHRTEPDHDASPSLPNGTNNRDILQRRFNTPLQQDRLSMQQV